MPDDMEPEPEAEQEDPNAAFIERLRQIRQRALYILVGTALVVIWVAVGYLLLVITHHLFGSDIAFWVLVGWTAVYAHGFVGAVKSVSGKYLKKVTLFQSPVEGIKRHPRGQH